ncbi:MAG TPA: hypothetical protein VMV44_14990, partial [Rectinemataceae bacterium]|nr:hypothetical protein [Rectinemataceae bacterium]
MRRFALARNAGPALLCLAFILASSCATRLSAPSPVDVLAPLDAKASVFVEAGGGDLDLLAR